MRDLSLATVGAVCALVTVAGFVVGIVLSIVGGFQVLIPETGTDGRGWIADVQDAGDLFSVSAWFVVFAGLFGLVALVGFYDSLREAGPVSLGVTFDTLASLSGLTNYFGNALGWGVAVPLYAIAILKTSALPRWIGWLGLVVALFVGWLGLLAPASDVVEGLTSIGFLGFFVFMASMGIAILLRRKQSATELAPASEPR